MAGEGGCLSSDDVVRGLWRENPTFVQMLGMCPTLAVSNSVINALSMGLATTFVLVMSNALVSSCRNFIPKEVRIASFILIIATFVTVVDYIIQAISVEIYNALGAFIALIVVNCIILGRAEAYASKNPILPSMLDGLGNGLGFTWAIFCMGSVREILGSGSFAGISIGDWFEPWVIFVLPGGGFFVLGMLLLIYSEVCRRTKARGA